MQDPNMKDIIRQGLKTFEQRYNVKILYAVESGSRAWGFESKDSDYDVRFIYISSISDYLKLEEPRDVIESNDGILDFVGWDLRKSLRLLRKSNPCLLEWLHSPIVYRDTEKIEPIKRAAANYFSAKRAIYHYLHMASGNFREYLQRDTVWLKKYLYVIRPILACDYILKQGCAIPMEFEKLLYANKPEDAVYQAIRELVNKKKQGVELAEGPMIKELNQWIETKIAFYTERVKTIQDTIIHDNLDELFAEMVFENEDIY